MPVSIWLSSESVVSVGSALGIGLTTWSSVPLSSSIISLCLFESALVLSSSSETCCNCWFSISMVAVVVDRFCFEEVNSSSIAATDSWCWA